MVDEKRSSGFWTTLPGVLTGLAALATALVSAYAVIRGPNNSATASPPAAATSAPVHTGAAAVTPAAATASVSSAAVGGCLPGYEPRKARPGDEVCVPPARSEAVAEENALAIDRREPNGGPYGVNTCKQGFVWREAVADDFVCVTPESRDQASRDNDLAGERSVQG